MADHRIVLDGSTTWPNEDAIRQQLHCAGCDLAGIIHIRPAAQLDALVTMLREQHETGAARSMTGPAVTVHIQPSEPAVRLVPVIDPRMRA